MGPLTPTVTTDTVTYPDLCCINGREDLADLFGMQNIILYCGDVPESTKDW